MDYYLHTEVIMTAWHHHNDHSKCYCPTHIEKMQRLSSTSLAMYCLYYPIHKYKSPRKNKKSNQGNCGYIILLRYVIAILNTVMLLFISRTREYLADAKAVQLTRNNQGLAQALLAIHAYNQPPSTEEEHKPYEAYRQASYLFQKDDSWHELWATHPSIKKNSKPWV